MNFVLWIALQIAVMELTARKLPDAAKPAGEGLSLPSIAEDTPLVYGVGAHRVRGSFIYAGDYQAQAVTKKVRVSLFKKQKVVQGYRIHAGLWLSLGALPADELQEIKLGEKVIWRGPLMLAHDAITEVPVDISWFAQEGQEVANGVKGKFLFFNSRVPDDDPRADLVNSYIDQVLGAGNAPAYDGTLHCVFLGPSAGGGNGFISLSNTVEPLTFTFYRLPNLSQIPDDYMYSIGYDSAQYIAETLGWVEGDANPALVILELLTTRALGIGPALSPYAIDVASFIRCAEKLMDEGHGVSFAWTETRPLFDVISDILAQIAATIDLDPATGRLSMRLIRSTDAPRATFTDANIIAIDSFTRQTNARPANEVQVSFVDRENGWLDRIATASDAAGARLAGSTVSVQKSYLGCTRAGVASMLASREQRIFASPLAKVRFSGFLPANVLQPGDVITFSHSTLGENSLKMRVLSARYADYSDRGRIDIEAIEDVFREGIVAASVSPLPQPDPTVPPASVIAPLALMAPYAITGRDTDSLLYVANDPGTSVDAYQLAVQENTASWLTDESEEYADSSYEPAIEALPAAAYASNATVINFNLTPDAAQQWSSTPRGSEFILFASGEWAECSSWTLTGTVLTASAVNRGVFDTVPGPVSAARILLGYVVDERQLKTLLRASDMQPLDGVPLLTARAESVGAGGLLRAGDAPASEVVWAYSAVPGRAFRPLPAANVSLGGVVGLMYENEAVPVARAATLPLTWAHRNRLARQLAPYFSAVNNPEPGSSAAYSIDYNDFAGSGWVPVTAGTSAESGVDVDTSGLPAGEVVLRVTLTARRDGAESYPTVVYFRVSA